MRHLRPAKLSAKRPDFQLAYPMSQPEAQQLLAAKVVVEGCNGRFDGWLARAAEFWGLLGKEFDELRVKLQTQTGFRLDGKVILALHRKPNAQHFEATVENETIAGARPHWHVAIELHFAWA